MRKNQTPVICGMDLGSRYVKMVLLNKEALVQSRMIETVEFYRQFGRRKADGLVVDFTAIGFAQAESLVVTGYGRNTIDIAGAKVISELKAHMLGAVWQTGLTDFTLLDLGGQDSKVVQVRGGRVANFDTNDKCAASTGRYLENMAQVLGISLAELSQHHHNPVELSATCAIFGESELISRIVEGYPVNELAAGVNRSIFRRIQPMLQSLHSDVVVFTGGVAQGGALRQMIENDLGCRVIVPAQAQLNGAIGCAVYGRDVYAAGN